jgi:nucleoid-associated protein YgaU
MRRQIVLYVIIALLGVGVGIGGGMLITKSKADKSKAIIADLQLKMQKSEMMSQEKIQDANAEIMRLKSELMQVKPELEQVRSGSAEPATTAYIVKEGDSLWKIAKSQLGDGNRYKEIVKLNPNIEGYNKGYIAVGTKLKIPTR